MNGNNDLQRMIEEMKPHFASNEAERDFTVPTLLRDVPSYTTTESGSSKMVNVDAELGGRFIRNIE